MSYWTGSGVNSQFYSMNLTCWECTEDYLAEFDAEGSSADIAWTCQKCGYENSQEVEL